MPPEKRKPRDIFSKEEIELILNNSDLETAALFSFLYISGCRINEAIGNEGLTNTEHNIRYDNRHVWFRLKTLKTSGVAVPYRSVNFKRDNHFLTYIYDHLAGVPSGKPLWKKSYWTYQRRLKKVVPTGWLHLFRITRATKMADAGKNVFQMMRWFGWADVKSALHYVQKSQRLVEGMGDDIE